MGWLSENVRYFYRVMQLLFAGFGEYALGLPRRESKPENHQPNEKQHASQRDIFLYALGGALALGFVYAGVGFVVGQSNDPAQRLDLFFTAALTVFTFLQAVFAASQWRVLDKQLNVSNRQIEIARRTARTAQQTANTAASQMRLDQRAWLSIKTLNILEPTEGDPVSCHVIVENNGKTPGVARRMRVRCFWERPSADSVRHRAKEVAEEMQSETPGEMPVAPGGVSAVEATIYDLSIAQLKGPRDFKAMFLIVRIEYSEVFRNTRISQKCYLLRGEAPVEYKYGNHIT